MVGSWIKFLGTWNGNRAGPAAELWMLPIARSTHDIVRHTNAVLLVFALAKHVVYVFLCAPSPWIRLETTALSARRSFADGREREKRNGHVRHDGAGDDVATSNSTLPDREPRKMTSGLPSSATPCSAVPPRLRYVEGSACKANP